MSFINTLRTGYEHVRKRLDNDDEINKISRNRIRHGTSLIADCKNID